ncbi:MAG: FCD domain-containing protein, partial [Pseudomonadota bacterium]
QLRAWLAQHPRAEGERLPPERVLCEELGVSRGELRKALAVLEGRGELWRHVGRGTFIGAAPADSAEATPLVADRTNPSEVMAARLAFEPLLASEAALGATAEDMLEFRACLDGARVAETWRQYEVWDNRLHRAIAVAADNRVLLALFNNLNTIRRAVTWGRLRREDVRPPADHHSFADHEAIVAAIIERDPTSARSLMRTHLARVRDRLLRVPGTD